MSTGKVKTNVDVQIVVEDATQDVFIEDLQNKCRSASRAIAIKNLFSKQGIITRELLALYLETLGMVEAAGPECKKEYYIRAAFAVDTINRILDRAGVSVNAAVVPRSNYE